MIKSIVLSALCVLAKENCLCLGMVCQDCGRHHGKQSSLNTISQRNSAVFWISVFSFGILEVYEGL